VVHWYLPGNVRHTNPGGTVLRHVMHRDQLSSTVLITDANADWGVERVYAPFGVDKEWNNAAAVDPLPEDIGFIGERKDAVSGLHYLNARYYDPGLRMFIQPDWFEVTEPGVGTNRYAYAGNDPVNLRDFSGNNFEPGGSEYGVDTDGDGKPDAFDRGYGVGGATQAQKGNPAIQGSFASGSQFAGFSKSVTSPGQAQSLANSGMTQAEAYGAFQDGLNDLALGAGLLAAPVEALWGVGLAAGRAATGLIDNVATSSAIPTAITPEPSKVSGVIAKFAKHALHQKMNRSVPSSAVLNAVKSPLQTRPVVIDKLGRPSQRIVGRKAEVVVNPETGKVISINPTSTKKAQRIMRSLGVLE